jgi:hypothetical protein
MILVFFVLVLAPGCFCVPSLDAFTIPKCGHCEALSPIWEDLRERVQVAGDEVEVRWVDCSDNRNADACTGIHSFPTIRFNDVVYRGARDAGALHLFVRKLLGPAIKFASLDANWVNEDVNGTVIQLRGDSCDEAAMEDIASRFRSKMLFVWDRTGHDCTVTAVRTWVNELDVWNKEDNLAKWVEQQQYPVVAPFDRYLHSTSNTSVAYMFYLPPLQALHYNAFHRAALSLRTHATRLLFALVDANQWDGLRTGISTSYPQVAIVDHARLNHHFPYPGQDWSGLDTWVSRYVQGQVERTLVGQLESSVGGDEVVASSLGPRVTARGDGRDVLVLFGSVHCGSSVAFRPVWDALVRELHAHWNMEQLAM